MEPCMTGPRWAASTSFPFSLLLCPDPGGCPVLSGLSAVSHLPPDGSEASRGVRRIQDTKYTQVGGSRMQWVTESGCKPLEG